MSDQFETAIPFFVFVAGYGYTGNGEAGVWGSNEGSLSLAHAQQGKGWHSREVSNVCVNRLIVI